MKRVVLLGDIHVYRLMTAPWRLFGKRLAGQANLWFRRRHRFEKSWFAQALERVEMLKPDLLLLSGDLTTTALRGEFEEAADVLRPIASKIQTVVIPGNHDRYTITSGWARTAEKYLGRHVPQQFPYWQALNEGWGLLAIDAAVPRAISSRGRIGRAQLARIQQRLDVAGADPPSQGLIVLCHYPFAVPSDVRWPWHHRLADAEPLSKLMEAASEKYTHVIYLHGHVHQPWWWQMGHGTRSLTVVNAGAPCCKNAQYPHGQGFWQIELSDDPVDGFGLIHHVPTRGGPDQWRGESVFQLSGQGQIAADSGRRED